MKRFPRFLVVIFSVSVGSIVFNLRHFLVATQPASARERQCHPPQSLLHDSIARNVTSTLVLGDMPGYTGWARPLTTTASLYTITPFRAVATTGNPVVWTLRCASCDHLHALFDTRAYGPSILPGEVSSAGNGTYHLSILFHDPGIYVVEVVLAFSHVAPLATFPSTNEPLYEGYLLPGSPFTIQIQNSGDGGPGLSPPKARSGTTDFQHDVRTDRRPREMACTAQDLLESSETSAVQKARWQVTSMVRDNASVPGPFTNTSFEEYRRGLGSIGFAADYVYHRCNLPSLPTLVSQSTLQPYKTKHTVVFIGDSHIRKQYNLFLEHFGGVLDAVHFKTNDGLQVRFSEIESSLNRLKRLHNANASREKIHILFNAGLHEIAILCSQRRVKSRGRIFSRIGEDFSCTHQYEENLIKLTTLVQSVPTASLVFQSTSAGWLKWGNYGFQWEPNRTQEYPLDSHACADFNQIAYNVMKARGVPVMDSFWLTVARPDHRQIDPLNSRGKKLVHSGVEVYASLLRKWMSIIMHMP